MIKKLGLQIKMVLAIFCILLLIMIAFLGLSKKVVTDMTEEKLQAQSALQAGKINAWTAELFSELKVYEDTINDFDFGDDEALLTYIESSYERNPAYPAGLYMGDDTGKYFDGSGWVPGDDWVLVERDWYIDGLDNEEFAFGEPYYDSQTGDMCVSASVRMDYTGAKRVLAIDVYVNSVVDMVREISADDTLECFLVTSGSHMVVAHPENEMMAVTLGAEGQDKLYGKISEVLTEKPGSVYELKGSKGKYYVCMEPVENTDWLLVTYVEKQQVMQPYTFASIVTVIITIVSGCLLFIGTTVITGSVVKPVHKMTDVINDIAEGDFSKNIKNGGSGEIAVMSRNMQMFIEKMRETIGEISETANWLKSQSVENEKASGRLLNSAQMQESAMVTVNRLADNLSSAAGEAQRQMDFLSRLVSETYEDGNTSKSLMDESVTMSKNGKNDMVRIHEGMNGINTSIAVLSEQIERVGSAMAQIESMVGIIVEIAEETNLLSLNASIEAARAGEAGKGFAVVAEQIGKLATNSNAAAEDISNLTAGIRVAMDEAVRNMENSRSEVTKSVEIVDDAQRTFVQLYGKVEETSRHVEKMISLIGQVEKVADQMKDITGNQYSDTLAIVESAKELNSGTEEVADSSRVVEKGAEDMKREAAALMDKISQFRIE